MKTSFCTKRRRHRLLLMATALMFIPAAPSSALDNLATPTGESVAAGSVTFSRPAEGQLNISQSSNRAIINWNRFDIGRDARTEFFQPGAASLAVNRVTGGGTDPTQIMGTLRANGRVMILDRNGILFGRDSVVDVSGLIASTGDVADADILDGGTMEITNVNDAVIENKGDITVADAGLAALVAPTVRNSGVINARLGRVSLAAGSRATVDLFGDNLISLAVDGDLDHALIENRGDIFAESGTVRITTDVAEDIVDNSINMRGVVDVSSIEQEAGRIILAGAQDATINGRLLAGNMGGGGDISVDANDIGIGRSGRLQADTTFTGFGGTVTLNAANSINSEGVITANGEEGGGRVLIGAGDSVNIGAGRIQARATGVSDGGLISITSGGDETRIAGSLNASGIDQAGRIALNAANRLTLTEDSKLFAQTLSTGPGGRIVMDAGEATLGGAMNVSGKEGGGVIEIASDSFVNATGKAIGIGETIGTGGRFTVDAAGDVILSGMVNMSGASGGGRISVNGDNVTVTDLRANAVQSDFPDIQDPADGGRVDLTGASGVTLDGRISARGGPFGGDGGQVTFSQPNSMTAESRVDVSGGPGGADGQFNN